MRFIPTSVHGVLDYLVGIALIAAPWLFGFADGGAAMWVPIVLGIGTIVYSAMTKYELGLARVIPMKTHLIIDGIAGVFLLLSPWLFGFSEEVWIPHAVVGIAEVLVAALTIPVPTPRGVNQPGTYVHP